MKDSREICLKSTEEFVYVVIGSESSGAVAATRLSEDPSLGVSMIEAKPAFRSLLHHIPAAAQRAFNARRFNWNYETEPDPYLD